jgi:chromate transporter
LRPKVSPLVLMLAFIQIGLSSVGGAAVPLRHILVVRRKWLSDAEFAEEFSIAQALPGASAANVGVFLALAGLCLPSLALALVLATVATHLSAQYPRFAAAEAGVTAAVAGMLIGNGIRLAWNLWHDAPQVPRRWRAGRLAIGIAAVILVAGLRFFIPAVLIVLAGSGLVLEWSRRRAATEAT